MYGYVGKVLIADLTARTFEIRDLDPSWAQNFIGGSALGARFMYDLMPANTDVFAPESVVGFVGGPVNNTKALMSARFAVVSKSPATGTLNDSNCGGNFAPYMKKAGFDAIFAKGISEKPVYIYVDDGVPSFRDASEMWGKTVSETDDLIKKDVGTEDVAMAVIGPGGEHKSYMAAVICDKHRAAGRGGSGAVMGSKLLKAVVCRGTHTVEVYDEAGVLANNKLCAEHAKGKGSVPVGKFRTTGTPSDYDSSVYQSDAGIKNWLGTPDDLTEEQISALTGKMMDPKFKKKQAGCMACHIRCGAEYKIEKYNVENATRPEYESLGAFGSMLLNGDPDSVMYCNYLCNEYGYDTLSFGGTMAWMMECYEKGIFTREELDGIDFTWGNADAIVEMAKKICNYEGIGIPLNLASKACAEYFGKGQECTVTARGMEIPMHGSRYNPGLAREFQYDPAPGRHTRPGLGVPYKHQPDEVKHNYSNTGTRDAEGMIEWELSNMSGFCSFGNFLMAPGIIASQVQAVTGFDLSHDELLKTTWRCFTMRLAFNIRDGLRRKDYTIAPRAVGKPPMEKGPLAGITVDNELMADGFFAALGWNVEEGIPTPEFLDRMGGLECVKADMYPEN